jgi:hypothetical protein
MKISMARNPLLQNDWIIQRVNKEFLKFSEAVKQRIPRSSVPYRTIGREVKKGGGFFLVLACPAAHFGAGLVGGFPNGRRGAILRRNPPASHFPQLAAEDFNLLGSWGA